MTAIIKLSSPATREFWEIPILHEDADLLALDKPARLLTSPDRYDPNRISLMKLLHRDIQRGAPWAKSRAASYLMPAHRLDLDTTGVLLLAKNKAALIHLANQFGSGKPHKTYLALATGSPSADEFETDAKLAPDPHHPGLMRVSEKTGKRSATRFKVLERFHNYTLLECRPITGRPHQIRVHLRHLGLPLAGDALYGGRPLLLSKLKPQYRLKHGALERPLIGCAALHAETLAIAHPATGRPLEIAAPWPKDMTVAVKYLRRYAQ